MNGERIKLKSIIAICLIVFAFVAYKFVANPRLVQEHERIETAPIGEPTATPEQVAKPEVALSTPHPMPSPSLDLPVTKKKNHGRGAAPDFEASERNAPTLEEFFAARPADLKNVLDKSTPYQGLRTAWVDDMGSNLAGQIIDHDRTFKFRYAIRFQSQPQFDPRKIDSRSCFAFRDSDDKEIVGSASDGSLEVRQAKIRTSYIFVIAGKDYFFTYNCRATDTPCRTWPGIEMLHYVKQSDGRILYRGRAKWAHYGEEIFKEPSRCEIQFRM